MLTQTQTTNRAPQEPATPHNHTGQPLQGTTILNKRALEQLDEQTLATHYILLKAERADILKHMQQGTATTHDHSRYTLLKLAYKAIGKSPKLLEAKKEKRLIATNPLPSLLKSEA